MSRNDPPWGANGVACLKAACAARDHHMRAALIIYTLLSMVA